MVTTKIRGRLFWTFRRARRADGSMRHALRSLSTRSSATSTRSGPSCAPSRSVMPSRSPTKEFLAQDRSRVAVGADWVSKVLHKVMLTKGDWPSALTVDVFFREFDRRVAKGQRMLNGDTRHLPSRPLLTLRAAT